MKCIAAIVLAMAAVILPNTASAADRDPMTRDLLLITDWFEGRFDNEEQRWFQGTVRPKISEEDKHTRIHTMHKRVNMPAIGKHVFYVEEYKDHNPEDVIRQRIVVFSTSGKDQRIRMQQGFFKDRNAALGGYKDPAKIEKLTSEDVFFLDRCDVYWKRVAAQFEGSMKPKACVFGEGADRRYSVHNLYLSPTKYWRVDSTFRISDDSLFAGETVDKPYELRRAKPFVCQIYFFADDGFTSEQTVEDLSLHSQGGTVRATRKSDGTQFELLMRDKEYPYYESRPNFIYFSLKKAGEERSIAFTVNDPDSRQLGVRTQSIGAFCHRKGYQFDEPLELLES